MSDTTSSRVLESAVHAAATTQPLASAAHSTLVNALSTPTVASLHDKAPASVNVVVRDPEELARKRSAMVRAGHSSLQVIADFDRTISAFRTSTGAMCAASHQLLESCVGFNRETFLPQMDAINEKFFAIEIDPHITSEARAAHMMDWWQQAHDLLLAQGIKHSAIEQAVRDSRESHNLELRVGASAFLRRLDAHSVPCLVFSAGLKETIAVTLKQEELVLPNVHLIGNEMEFDAESGLLTAFGSDTITSSNKNYTHVLTQQPRYHAATLARRNLILLGDNLGDADMARGLEDVANCIKIGLLHDNVAERLEQFATAFDIVLLNDADFSYAQQLVDDILAGTETTPAQQ